jgi:hypothetical protein
MRRLLPKVLTPFPQRLVSHLAAPLQPHFLNVPVAQGKGAVEPDAVTELAPGKR